MQESFGERRIMMKNNVRLPVKMWYTCINSRGVLTHQLLRWEYTFHQVPHNRDPKETCTPLMEKYHHSDNHNPHDFTGNRGGILYANGVLHGMPPIMKVLPPKCENPSACIFSQVLGRRGTAMARKLSRPRRSSRYRQK